MGRNQTKTIIAFCSRHKFNNPLGARINGFAGAQTQTQFALADRIHLMNVQYAKSTCAQGAGTELEADPIQSGPGEFLEFLPGLCGDQRTFCVEPFQ